MIDKICVNIFVCGVLGFFAYWITNFLFSISSWMKGFAKPYVALWWASMLIAAYINDPSSAMGNVLGWISISPMFVLIIFWIRMEQEDKKR